MDNVKNRISSGLMFFLMAVTIAAVMSIGMSTKVYASNSNSGSPRYNSSGDHNIRVTSDGHGTGRPDHASASSDAIINLYATPDPGYVFDKWTTTDAINIINPTSANDAYFRMIDSDVTVKANFKSATQPATTTSGNGAKYHYDHHDSDDHDEETVAPNPKPAEPNALIAATFMWTDGNVHGNVKIGPQIQGSIAQLAFRVNTPNGWKEAFSFNMTVNDKADHTPKTGKLSFKIPVQYIKEGRKFAVLGLDKNGDVKVFNDTGGSADSITVNLDIEGYAFDLIYFD